jgi:hypothetical protein
VNEIDPAFFLQMEFLIYVSVEGEKTTTTVSYQMGESLYVALSVARQENLLRRKLNDALQCEDKDDLIISLTKMLLALQEKRSYLDPELDDMEYYTTDYIEVEIDRPLTEDVIKQAGNKSTPLIVCRKCKFIFSWRLDVMLGGGFPPTQS